MSGWRERQAAAIRDALADARPGARGRLLAKCPFCEERTGKADHHGKLAVWPSGYARCYKCKFRGFLDGYAPEHYTADDLEDLTDRVDGAPELPEGFAPLFGSESFPDHYFAREYMLEERGLPRHALEEAGVGATLSGPYRGRVIVPVFAPGSREWLSFVARDFTKASKVRVPYLTAKPDDGWAYAEMLFFNEGALDVETDEPALVVEGCFDALWLWPAGVATLGSLSEWQVWRLSRARRPVVLVSDGDAWAEGLAISERLRVAGARTGALKLPPGTDPDELPRADIERAARAAVAGGSTICEF